MWAVAAVVVLRMAPIRIVRAVAVAEVAAVPFSVWSQVVAEVAVAAVEAPPGEARWAARAVQVVSPDCPDPVADLVVQPDMERPSSVVPVAVGVEVQPVAIATQGMTVLSED